MPLLQHLQQRIDVDWSQVPIVLATQARVAIGDEIGEALKADLVLVLIGERPGLSSPDSLGAYLTYQPKLGRMDSERNCVSNIHAAGMSYAQAAHKISYLIQESLRRKCTGVELKDDSDTLPLPSARSGKTGADAIARLTKHASVSDGYFLPPYLPAAGRAFP